MSLRLREQAGITEVLVHTGQHYDADMSDVFFDELEIAPPNHSLGIGGGSHAAQTARMLEGLEPVLLDEAPDLVLVYAKTSPEKGAKGISAFIVETDTPGFKVAQKLNKMGFRGSPTGELVFEDCRVPARNMVGKLDGGVAVTMSGLDLERAIVCFNALGIAQRALDISIDYAKTRQQFGKPIASFQMVQAMLADMYTQIEAARSLSLKTAAMCEGLEEGEGGRGEIHKLTAAAIFKAAEATSFVLDKAVQIHGGSGYMRDTEVNRLYRTGRVLEVGAGTQEVRKLIISGELLKN